MSLTLWKILNFFKQKSSFLVLSVLNLLIPKNSHWIYIFDRDLKKDNAWAIMQHLSGRDYANYTVFYFSTKPFPSSATGENVVRVTNPLKALWYQLRSKYVFYSYREFAHMKPMRNLVIVDTMHGSPLKTIGYLASHSRFRWLWRYEDTFSYILCQSEFFKSIVQKAFGASDRQCLIVGYPRNDVILKDQWGLAKLGIDKRLYQRTVLWLPTYRAHDFQGHNRDSNVAFPLLTQENIGELNEFLAGSGVLLVIKPHPLQAELPVLKQRLSHITIFGNDFLNERNVELYGLFSEVDALLTDYSSVFFDFLLTLKPIGFVIDDISQYGSMRGFTVEDPLGLMPGHKIYNVDDLKKFIADLVAGVDPYSDERQRINDLANKYQDSQSSTRLMKALGIGPQV